MKTIIRHAQIVLKDRLLEDASLMIEDGTIVQIGTDLGNKDGEISADEVIDANGGYIFPGFIDLHVHGGDGFDYRDANDEAYRKIGTFHANRGTTALLVTMGSSPPEELAARLEHGAQFIRKHSTEERWESYGGAQMLGIHLEGPFISPKHPGNMKPEYMIEPAADKMQELLDAADGFIRLVTLAPELPGAEHVIRLLAAKGIIASAGHTGATYEEMEQAINQGIIHVTHCYNAMRGFHHREPAIMTSALLNNNVTAEYIGDFVHSHPAAGELLFRMKGYQRVALITDATRNAGIIKEAPRNEAGNLAGSSIGMIDAVRNVITGLGLKPWEAAQMASLTPAQIIQADDRKGSIQEGKDADLVITDLDFQVKTTLVKGKKCGMNHDVQ